MQFRVRSADEDILVRGTRRSRFEQIKTSFGAGVADQSQILEPKPLGARDKCRMFGLATQRAKAIDIDYGMPIAPQTP